MQIKKAKFWVKFWIELSQTNYFRIICRVHTKTPVLESLLKKVVGLKQLVQNSSFTEQIWTDTYAVTDPWEWRKRKCAKFVKKEGKKFELTPLKHLPGTNSLETQAIATSIIWIQFSLLQDSIYVKSGSFNQLWALCKVISIGAAVSRCSSKKVLLNFANFTAKHLCWSLFHCHLFASWKTEVFWYFQGV